MGSLDPMNDMCLIFVGLSAVPIMANAFQVPIMLLPKPLILLYQHNQSKKAPPASSRFATSG
jgi:hypothetical protein